MPKDDVINKFKTLSQGRLSDSVLDKMALTFTALVKLADFQSPAQVKEKPKDEGAKKEGAQGPSLKESEENVIRISARTGRPPLCPRR